jgi:hypothetical protein
VRHIVESLEDALEQMEEVLRLVQVAEGQKNDDERELESLRRALRRIQPPRGEPERERRPEPRREREQPRPEEPSREEPNPEESGPEESDR